MFGRATIRLGIGPHSSFVYCICYILTWCVVLVVLDTTVGSNVSNSDSLCDLNCRNSMLENMKLKLPSVYKTGTTIAGVVFKVGVTLLLYVTVVHSRTKSLYVRDCCKNSDALVILWHKFHKNRSKLLHLVCLNAQLEEL